MSTLRRILTGATLSAAVILAASGLHASAEARGGRVVSFDRDWRFFKGEAAGAEQPGFDDRAWQPVDLPHDWSIEGPYDEKNPGKSAFGYLPGGVGWYRKEFEVPAADAGKKLFLQFDGIYENSKVWLNGFLLGERGYGFLGFEYDLTPHLNFGGKNTVVVRADNLDQPNCRWYSGSGIYRHAWLTATDPVHVAHWGTYVTVPKLEAAKAQVRIRTLVRNDGASARNISLETTLLDPAKTPVATIRTDADLPPGGSRDITQEAEVPSPRLWSVEDPEFYSAVSRVVADGKPTDEISTPFGIRSVRFEKDRGLVLNGKSVKMKGVCVHGDGGAVGAAVPAGVWERRLKTLREIGCNAIRCSHNPPAPEFLDLCDRMGFLVIDEAFDKWQYENARHFEKDWERDLMAMLERDRNHPCIVLWSVGNENGGAWTPKQFETYRKLADVVHREEPTRPVTAALRPFDPPKENPTKEGLIAQLLPMVKALDVPCLNYQEHLFEDLHKADPDLVLISSESHLYYRGEGTKYKADNDNNPWFDVEKNGFVAGQFLWTGIDYLGESEGWPAKGKANSLIETTGFRKDCSYWHQSVWSDKPMVHIAVFDETTEDYPQKKYWHWPKIRSHWNFAGREHQTFKVATYSNCAAVELFLNGRSLGVKKPADFKNRAAMWEVPYEPGELKAVGRNGGETAAEWTLRTAGPAARITLVPDRKEIRADGGEVAHLEVRIEDQSGTLVPDAALPLSFKVEGAARLIGLDNGDLRSGEPYQGTTRTTYRGRCLAILQAKCEAKCEAGREAKSEVKHDAEPVKVTVSTPSLPPASLELESR